MLGITVPFHNPLSEQRQVADNLATAGYESLWTAETSGADAFSPLLLAASQPDLHLGTAIASVYARSPALLAMSSSALAEAAPGRVTVGLGASAAGMVENWHDRPYDRPYQRVVDTTRFLRAAFSGERVDNEFATFSIRGFTLDRPPLQPPRIMIAALRARMLAAAGAESDGVLLNWLGPDDVPSVTKHVQAARPADAGPADVMARIFICPSDDPTTTKDAARAFLARYLTVPVYEQYHRWLGRGHALEDLWSMWKARERAAAIRSIPDEVVDDLVGIGDADTCASFIQRYVDNGVTDPVVKILPLVEGMDECHAAMEVARAFRTGTSGR